MSCGAVAAVGEQPRELRLVGADRARGVAADRAREPERRVLEQDRARRAARPSSDTARSRMLLGELLQVQGGGDGEPDLVDGLELDLPIALLEALDAQAIAQLADLFGLGEQQLVRARRVGRLAARGG